MLLQNKRKAPLHDSFYPCAHYFSPYYYPLINFQGWSVSDIGPFEAPMLLCSCEDRTKETLDPKKLESGELKLSDLLMDEDFAKAHSVS